MRSSLAVVVVLLLAAGARAAPPREGDSWRFGFDPDLAEIGGYKSSPGISGYVGTRPCDWCEWGLMGGYERLPAKGALAALPGSRPLTIQNAGIYVKAAMPLDRVEPFFELGGGVYFLDGGSRQTTAATASGPVVIDNSFHRESDGGIHVGFGGDFFANEHVAFGLRFAEEMILIGKGVKATSGIGGRINVETIALRFSYSFDLN